MLSTLCLLAIRSQAPLDFEMRAARLPVVVEAFSQKTGEKLFCSPELGRQVLVVKFTGVTSTEAKAKIAEVADAEWVDRNGTLTLLRTPGKQRELDAKYQAGLDKAMGEALDELDASVKKVPKFDIVTARKLLDDLNALDSKTDDPNGYRDWRAAGREHMKGPGGRAIIKILTMLGTRELTTLPVGRTVYATNPTRLQKPLPNGVDNVLRTWDSEQQVWDQALRAKPPSEPKDGFTSTDPRFTSYGDNRAQKVILAFKRYGPKANISCSITGYDATGTPQFSSSVDLVPKWAIQSGNVRAALEAGLAKGTYTLSPESQERVALSSLDYKEDIHPTAEQIKVYSDPVARDPLSFEHSEILLAVANGAKVNMVASLSDLLILPSTQGGDPKLPINLDGYLKYNELMGNIQVEKSDKWILIKPFSKEGEPTLPEDRFVVKKLIQSGLQTGYFTIEALADYALTADVQWNPLSFYLARILLPRSERLLQDMDVKGLRFFGSLSPIQRRELLAGNSIGMNTLSNTAKGKLIEFALDGDSRDGTGGLYVNGQNTSMRLANHLNAEPTEFLARGTAGNLITSSIKSNDQMMIGTPQNGNYSAWTHFSSPENYRNSLRNQRGTFGKDDNFWVGQTVQFVISANLGPQIEAKMSLKEHRYDLRKAPLKFDQLPDEIKKRISGDGT